MSILDRAPTCEAIVTVDAPVADARARLGDAATVEAVDEHTSRARCRAETAEWLAARLGALGCDYAVEGPEPLVEPCEPSLNVSAGPRSARRENPQVTGRRQGDRWRR